MAIGVTLYAAPQISHTLSKGGDLPEVHECNIFHNAEGVIISTALIIPMILFLDLAQIAATAVEPIQGFTHPGHLFKHQ